MKLDDAIRRIRFSAKYDVHALSVKEALEMGAAALEKQIPKAIIPNKRIPEIGRCPTCKQDLCMDDEKLHYCPTCGTHLVTPSQMV